MNLKAAEEMKAAMTSKDEEAEIVEMKAAMAMAIWPAVYGKQLKIIRSNLCCYDSLYQ
jgi:hypothetical protein